MNQLGASLKNLSAELAELRQQNRQLRAQTMNDSRPEHGAALSSYLSNQTLIDQKIKQLQTLSELLEERSEQQHVN